MNPHNLNIVNEKAQIDEQTINEVAENLEAEYKAHKAQYRAFQEKRENTEVTPANVRRTALWVVGSIKTDTQLVDSGANDILSGDFAKDRKFLLDTEDGQVKWDRYGEWFTSQIPDRVSDLLAKGRIDDAHALLAGRDPDTGKRVGEYYLRANKASLVLYLLGFDRICLDTRIYRAVKPVIRELFKDTVVNHPESELGNPYRNVTPRADADYVPVYSHSGDPEFTGEKSYWEDKLKWNIPQYKALTGHIRDKLAEVTHIPPELIPQVAFNTQGATTTHGDLMNRIQE